jgi:hypothetical protein
VTQSVGPKFKPQYCKKKKKAHYNFLVTDPKEKEIGKLMEKIERVILKNTRNKKTQKIQ